MLLQADRIECLVILGISEALNGESFGYLHKHPIREALIRNLWHRGEPASAVQLQADQPAEMLAGVVYHPAQLERGGVVERAREGGDGERFYVVAGPKASAAVRLLGLA